MILCYFYNVEKCIYMEKLYQVYSVDFCFEDYAIDYRLIGAEDVDDVIAHLRPFVTYKKELKKIEEEKEWRIRKVEHLYTDTPYKILDSYGYIE